VLEAPGIKPILYELSTFVVQPIPAALEYVIPPPPFVSCVSPPPCTVTLQIWSPDTPLSSEWSTTAEIVPPP
jgi:hypothetical protein